MSYKYYSTERPVAPGTFPKPQGNKVLNIENFDDRTYIEQIDREAWGFIEYDKPVCKIIADDFELVGEAMEIKKGMKFRGNVSGQEIEIMKADNRAVTYRDCKRGTVHTVGRKAFERWNVKEVN